MEEKRVWNIQKYKDIEKFRAFNDIRISNIDFLEKFSKLYKIFQKEISNNKTDYIAIKNQDLIYIKGINSIITKEKIVSDNIDEVDNYIKEINEKYKGIKFNILDMREFSFLNEKHILSKGYWWYKSENTYKNSRSINGIGDFKVMGIFKLNESVKQIQKEKIITSNFLILFKIFLELDFIIKTEFEKEFEDLVAQYKKYYKYLSAINYDSKENKIVIIWNKEKLAKDLEVIQNENFKIEIPYNANELGVEREIISLNKKMYYFGNGDREELILGKNYIDSKYYFYNGNIEKIVNKLF